MTLEAIMTQGGHVLLVMAVIVLWRRVVKLDTALAECLARKELDAKNLRDDGLPL